MDETFRPRSNLAWAGCSLILITLFAINTLLVVGDTLQKAFEILVCVILSAVAYLMWIRPKLLLQSDSVIVVNPLETVKIAYADIIDFKTQWILTIVHSNGETKVWVAPATGKRRWIADKKFGWFGSNMPLSSHGDFGMESMSQSLESTSGQAAYAIRERIKRAH